MPDRLKNRIALITGSSSGIGRATALLYAQEGATVACADITETTWRDAPSNPQQGQDESNGPTHTRITAAGGTAIYLHCDVTSPSSVESAIATTVQQFGRLDIMINNAGFALEARAPAPVWETPLDLFDKTMAANVAGVFYGVKYASAQMIKQEPLPNGERGVILNAASVFGLVGTPGAPAYCTSKGAVVNLTRAAALDCAPYGVRVAAVNPGYTATHMTDGIFGDREALKGVEEMHPYRGVGRPEDLAKVYVFLASDDAGWVSGVNLPVDGGYTAR